MTITILTGYFAEMYFASLRFIVQGLSSCQTQNQRLVIRHPISLFLSRTQAAHGKKMVIKIELRETI